MRSYLSKLNYKSHQYPYFRSVIPKDILVHFDGITEFRLSLSSVRKEVRQIVCLKLKQITDQLFDEIRDQVRTLSGRHKGDTSGRSEKVNSPRTSC